MNYFSQGPAAHPAAPGTPRPPDAAERSSETQLLLPLPDLLKTAETWKIPRHKRVFVNRDLRMSEVDWVGFDMDYTLAIYNQPEMDQLQIQATLPKMIARGYPAFIRDEPYDINFPIRGLMIDKALGHVLKMDRYKVVQKACHGLRELDKRELRALYHEQKINFASPRYHWIDVLYALSEVAMYATIIDAMERRSLFVDYAKLFSDIRECIDEAHRDCTVLDAVANDYPRFVLRDPDLALALHKLRSAGKKLFLLTNSRWTYTDRMMQYLLGDALHDYPSWRHVFDVVVVAAGKPTFFQERRPLFEREGEALRPVGHGTLEGGRVYEGGSLHEFQRLLGTTGDRVLYIGDHIYGDILRSKKESAWRTAMVIQEMTAEVLADVEGQADTRRLVALEESRQQAEDELRYLQARYKELARNADQTPVPGLEAERGRVKKGVELVRTALKSIEEEIVSLEHVIDRRFHAYWGSLLKESNEMSSFGKQVEEYACVYTSKVSNFLAYSPRQHFRSPRDRMPHEL